MFAYGTAYISSVALQHLANYLEIEQEARSDVTVKWPRDAVCDYVSRNYELAQDRNSVKCYVTAQKMNVTLKVQDMHNAIASHCALKVGVSHGFIMRDTH